MQSLQRWQRFAGGDRFAGSYGISGDGSGLVRKDRASWVRLRIAVLAAERKNTVALHRVRLRFREK